MALISIILSLLIIAIIILTALMLYRGGQTHETGPVTTPIEKGKAVQCLAQVRRVETAVQMYRAEQGAFPPHLNELTDLAEEDYYCPVTDSPYDYNPATGKVTCPDHPR